MTPYDDCDEEEDYYDEFQFWEDECGLTVIDGEYFCPDVGSEGCSFHCPYSKLIGVPVDDAPDEGI